MNRNTFFTIVISILALYLLMRVVNSGDDVGDKTADTPPPREKPEKPSPESNRWVADVRTEALFSHLKPTGVTGMQWDNSWQFLYPDLGAFVFTHDFDGGLLIGLSSGMSDLNDGYLLQFAGLQGGGGLSHLTSYHNKGKIDIPIDAWTRLPPGEYWVSYDHGVVDVGQGHTVGQKSLLNAKQKPLKVPVDNVPVHAWHMRPVKGEPHAGQVLQNIKYFGFGTATEEDTLRKISGVKVKYMKLL
jgi:hypothetical protein